jgi:hypothetical protein
MSENATNPQKPKKVLTEQQLEVLAKARAKAAETRRSKAEQRAKQAALQEELRALEAEKLQARVDEARKEAAQPKRPEKEPEQDPEDHPPPPPATPAPPAAPAAAAPAASKPKPKPFVAARKARRDEAGHGRVETAAVPRQRPAPYDRSHWDTHARAVNPIEDARAVIDDRRAKFIARSVYGI